MFYARQRKRIGPLGELLALGPIPASVERGVCKEPGAGSAGVVAVFPVVVEPAEELAVGDEGGASG